jgi:hypothetical protein
LHSLASQFAGIDTRVMAKRPRDPNQLAKLIVDIASGEVEDTVSPRMKASENVRGRAGGMRGGNARAKSLTSEERRKIAKKAAETRWKL